MHCFLSSCNNDSSKFEKLAGDDCIRQHILILKREIDKISTHYEAIRKEQEKDAQAHLRYERKYKEEKEKNLRLTEKNSKSLKRKYSENSKKSRQEVPLRVFAPNTLEASNETPNTQDLFKSKDKAVVGKENSPKKRDKNTKMSEALTFSKLGNPYKNLPSTSSPKLKQPKINFSKISIPIAKPKPSKSNKQPDPMSDVDLTFCEVLEKSKKLEPLTNHKLLKFDTAVPTRRSSSSVNPLRRTKTDGRLFQFQELQQTKKSATITRHNELKDPDVTQDNFLGLKIKQEKKSQTVGNISDSDLFSSDVESSQGSSVFVLETDEKDRQPITIYSDDDMTAELEKGFAEQSEYRDLLQVSPGVPGRKPKKMYGDCRDCRDFYERFAEINGATQAESYIRQCPEKCQGFRLRVRQAQPPPAPPTQESIRRDSITNPTPEGFWDIPSHFGNTEDPDRTQDGLC